MWLDHFVIDEVGTGASLPEAEIAEVLQATTSVTRDRIALVLDARAPGATGGATATYRLLSALNLRRAAPIATSTSERAAARSIIDALRGLVPASECALIVAAAPAQSKGAYVVSGCIATRDAHDRRAVEVNSLGLDGPTRYRDGFIDLIDRHVHSLSDNGGEI